MTWPPFFTLDLAAQGMLPADWDRGLQGVADGTEPALIESGETLDHGPWSFAIVQGDVLRDRCGWLWALYRGAMLDFARDRFDRPLFTANRLRSAITLNILSGAGASIGWHTDANPVSGLFFATSPATDHGGDLMFRAGGREARLTPRAGTFVCFDASVEHRVEKLATGARRLSVPMVYYASAVDQPAAYGEDIYQ